MSPPPPFPTLLCRNLVNILKESPDLVGAEKIAMQPNFRGKHTADGGKEQYIFSPVINKNSRRLAMNNRGAFLQQDREEILSPMPSATDKVDLDVAASTIYAGAKVDQLRESTLNVVVSGIDVIAQRLVKKQQAIEKLKEKIKGEELKHCTFRPSLVGRMEGSAEVECVHTPAFERLYVRAKSAVELKNQGKSYKVPYVCKEDTEMDECVFSPLIAKSTRISDELACFLGKPIGAEMSRTEGNKKINTYIRDNNLQDSSDGRKINPDVELNALLKVQPGDELTYFNLQHYLGKHFSKIEEMTPLRPEGEYATGFKEAVERVRAHRTHLLREPERRLAELAASEARYDKARKLLARGPNPPSFLTDERILKKKQDRAKKIEPRLYVDVKLSNTKTACIPILDDDDPAAIAMSFCRIYALNKEAHDILEEVVRQSMEVNQVRIAESVPGIVAPTCPMKLSSTSIVLRRKSADDGDDKSDLDSRDDDESTESTDSGTDDSEGDLNEEDEEQEELEVENGGVVNEETY